MNEKDEIVKENLGMPDEFDFMNRRDEKPRFGFVEDKDFIPPEEQKRYGTKQRRNEDGE